jgi:hypothetical protein
MPGARRTRSLVCAWELSMHTSIHSEVAKIIRHPHTMVYGLWRAPRRSDESRPRPSTARTNPMYRMGMTGAEDIIRPGEPIFLRGFFQQIRGSSPASQTPPSEGAVANAPTRALT